MAEDDDPVVASYDVFLTKPHSTTQPVPDQPDVPLSKILVLQYPAHRPFSKPYNAARSQKPISLRMKPETGLVELEVPISTTEHYNIDAGSRYGKAISESRTVQSGGTHGLAGGFSTPVAQPTSLRDVPQHEDALSEPTQLETQTLGGKISGSNERDPVYLLGSFRNNALHLSHLDAVVQMRPQLHHIDAEEENNQKRFQTTPNGTGMKPKPGLEQGPAKLESKAIEIKIKDNKDDAKDRNLNENAKLLRDIQKDGWRKHNWIDQEEPSAVAAFDRHLHLQQDAGETFTSPPSQAVKLRSAISNGDWLDKMSAPREDGKKGLLAKLRGRERERARRKKAEEEKKMRTKGVSTAVTATGGPLMDMSSGSEPSSASDTDAALEPRSGPTTLREVDMTDVGGLDNVEIKEEPGHSMNITPSATSSTRKRGRPRKSQAAEPIEVED